MIYRISQKLALKSNCFCKYIYIFITDTDEKASVEGDSGEVLKFLLTHNTKKVRIIPF